MENSLPCGDLDLAPFHSDAHHMTVCGFVCSCRLAMPPSGREKDAPARPVQVSGIEKQIVRVAQR